MSNTHNMPESKMICRTGLTSLPLYAKAIRIALNIRADVGVRKYTEKE